MLGPWARLSLVPTIVPALEGVHDRLAAGTLVADVGCGAGVALTALAEAYPRSTFHGYELSRLAVERARTRIAEAGLTNVEIIDRRAEELPDGGDYSLVLTFDCLHDMTRPDAAPPRSGVPSPTTGPGWSRRSAATTPGRQPPQPDAGHVPRLLDRLVHVLGAVRAGRRRAGHDRAAAQGAGATDAPSRLHAVPGARLRGPGQPLLRGPTLTADG